MDGVSFSEGGMNHLRSLQLDQPRRRCRNKKSLESDDKDEVQGDGQEDSLFKDGTVLTPREDGRMPDVTKALNHHHSRALQLKNNNDNKFFQLIRKSTLLIPLVVVAAAEKESIL